MSFKAFSWFFAFGVSMSWLFLGSLEQNYLHAKSDAWSTRTIDRPLSLPANKSAWHWISGLAWDQLAGKNSGATTGDRTGKNHTTPFFYPLYWEQGLTDDWTLIWSPFPFDFRYQFFRSENWALGGELFLFGKFFARFDHFRWRPSVEVFQRYRLTSDFALQARVIYQIELSRSLEYVPQTPGLKLGGLYQLTDRLAITPFVGGYRVNRGTADLYLGKSPSAPEEVSLRFPMGLNLNWNLTNKLETRFEYTWFNVGYAEDFESHQAFFRFILYWDNPEE